MFLGAYHTASIQENFFKTYPFILTISDKVAIMFILQMVEVQRDENVLLCLLVKILSHSFIL